jgi:hypothetical protein
MFITIFMFLYSFFEILIFTLFIQVMLDLTVATNISFEYQKAL